jgi:phosphoribosylformylglycinamidine cyclo-ligase
MIGGETASLPEIVNNFDLAGTGIGIVDIDDIVTGENIMEGNILIGICSSGIHSNGLSLARKVFFQDAGLNVDDELPGFPQKTVGEELLRPTRIYVKPIMELLKSDVTVHGLAHITGGGFNNLKRLNQDVGYYIDDLPQPNPVFESIFSLGVPLEEMYRVFNMGIGMVVIVPEEDSQNALNIIKKHDQAHIIGNVTGKPETVTLMTLEDTLIDI